MLKAVRRAEPESLSPAVLTLGAAQRSGAAGEHRAAGTMASPVRPPGGEALALGLVIVRVAQELEQLEHQRGVALLCVVDGQLGEAVAEDVLRIDGVHALLAGRGRLVVRLVVLLLPHAGGVPTKPGQRPGPDVAGESIGGV